MFFQLGVLSTRSASAFSFLSSTKRFHQYAVSPCLTYLASTQYTRHWSSTQSNDSGDQEESGVSSSSAVQEKDKKDDILAEYRNENNIDDQVFSAMSGDGGVKVTACTARNIINDLMIMHTMTATPADALGRTLVCGLLMSNGMQEEQTLQLTFNCKFHS